MHSSRKFLCTQGLQVREENVFRGTLFSRGHACFAGGGHAGHRCFAKRHFSPPVSYLAQREAGGLVLPEERAHEPLSPLVLISCLSLTLSIYRTNWPRPNNRPVPHRGRRRQQLDERLKKTQFASMDGVVCVCDGTYIDARSALELFGRGDTLDTCVSPDGDTPSAPLFR